VLVIAASRQLCSMICKDIGHSWYIIPPSFVPSSLIIYLFIWSKELENLKGLLGFS
jgi:hypothetical protein